MPPPPSTVRHPYRHPAQPWLLCFLLTRPSDTIADQVPLNQPPPALPSSQTHFTRTVVHFHSALTYVRISKLCSKTLYSCALVL
ncbi:hypothetical protein CROQUDRAFT_652013, partial [Cronartium quercuum f. sp. fusiforme G11]